MIAKALEMARNVTHGRSAIILSDGKAGDEAQCLGVVERLGLTATIRHVSPRPAFALAMPWFGIDPREAPDRPASPIGPPWPDIAIASGRRTVTYLRALKTASGRAIFTVFLKDPRTGSRAADFIWVPEHDRLRGANVLTTLTGPHRFSPERLAAARAAVPAEIARLPAPRIGLLVGGDSRHHRFSPQDVARFEAGVAKLIASGAGVMATTSRRTPHALASALRARILSAGGYFWEGSGENPYPAMLAIADSFVVTADSTNMVGEVLATGRPVHVFTPSGGGRRIDEFLNRLSALGLTRPFEGALETYSYEPIDATVPIAIELARRFEAFRAGRAPA